MKIFRIKHDEQYHYYGTQAEAKKAAMNFAKESYDPVLVRMLDVNDGYWPLTRKTLADILNGEQWFSVGEIFYSAKPKLKGEKPEPEIEDDEDEIEEDDDEEEEEEEDDSEEEDEEELDEADEELEDDDEEDDEEDEEELHSESVVLLNPDQELEC